MAGRARKGKNEGKGKITNFPFSLYKYSERDKIILVQEMGARLMAGQQTLNLYVEVRLLCAQPVKSGESQTFSFIGFALTALITAAGLWNIRKSV